MFIINNILSSCPDGAMVNSGPRNDCQWLAGNQGDNVTCPNAQLAFGHCQTSQASVTGNAGDCHKSSVEVQSLTIIVTPFFQLIVKNPQKP